MTPKLMQELIQKLERFRSEVSELIYAGVPTHLINEIPDISRAAVEEIAYQIECKEEELFNINKEQTPPTKMGIERLIRDGVPMYIINRIYREYTKEQLHEIAKPTRKQMYQSYLTKDDMDKRKHVIRTRTDDYIYLYIQIGGVEEVFSAAFKKDSSRNIRAYIREVDKILPSNNPACFKSVVFPYKPKPFKRGRVKKTIKESSVQGSFLSGLKVRQRIEKLNLMSAVHGIEVLARETLLSEDLVGYLMNVRLQKVLEENLGIILPTRGIIKQHPEIYNNVYGFDSPTDSELINEAFLCFHREHNRYFSYLSKSKFKQVADIDMPFDMMLYLTSLSEIIVATAYYTDIKDDRQYSWVIPFNPRMLENQSDEVSIYLNSKTNTKTYKELNNLVNQVKFSLSHLKVGKEFINLMISSANNHNGLYWALYSHCLTSGISLNTTFTYVAPVYIRKSLVPS